LKSGSNAFKGSAGYYGQFQAAYGNNTPDAQYPPHIHHNNDFNFTFGGPIKKDRLWFQYINENIRRLQTPVGVPPDLAQPVKISHTATDFLKGTHEFKFGVQTAPWNTSIARGSYASGTKFYDLGGDPYYIVVQEPYARGARIRTAGMFAQDDWTVSDRVALNLGVRYDHTGGDVPDMAQLN